MASAVLMQSAKRCVTQSYDLCVHKSLKSQATPRYPQSPEYLTACASDYAIWSQAESSKPHAP
eukprot:scaffold74878_cov64-Phaeocystis_antarctica.AAC.4